MQILQEGTDRLTRLKNPIQAWTDVMGQEVGQPDATIRRCRLLRQADEEIYLDDEGAINKVRLSWEMESNQAVAFSARAEWSLLTLVKVICFIGGSGLT